MADQQTVEQQMREQYKVVEDTAQDVARNWNDLVSATTEWSFDVAQKSLGYSLRLQSQNERVFQETLSTYRDAYQQGFRAWQGYVQGVYEIVSRSTRT